MREVTLAKRSVAARTAPSSLVATRSIAEKVGTCRLRMASITTTPRSRPASNTSRASRSFEARDFSTSTCLPPPIIARACAAWAPLGLET